MRVARASSRRAGRRVPAAVRHRSPRAGGGCRDRARCSGSARMLADRQARLSEPKRVLEDHLHRRRSGRRGVGRRHVAPVEPSRDRRSAARAAAADAAEGGLAAAAIRRPGRASRRARWRERDVLDRAHARAARQQAAPAREAWMSAARRECQQRAVTPRRASRRRCGRRERRRGGSRAARRGMRHRSAPAKGHPGGSARGRRHAAGDGGSGAPADRGGIEASSAAV
jgi:hypothetical protein